MTSEDDQLRAQRVSDYADSLIVQRRTQDSSQNAPSTSSDREFADLASLAEMLSGVRIEPPQRVEFDVARRIGELADQPLPSRLLGSAWRRWRGRWPLERQSPRGISVSTKPILFATANLLLIAIVLAFVRSSSLSAAEVLARTDEALVSLAQPGKVLFRRWRIIDRIREGSGGPERIEHRSLLEWVDGTNMRRATAKTLRASGRTYVAYANGASDERPSPQVYYEPGYANEPLGLLSIVPSREEFDEALKRFNGPERRILETYLARGYIYEPIFSELQFNRAMLTDVAGIEPLQRVRLSVESATLEGRPVYKVRSSDDVRLQFRWRSNGPPHIWLERQETVRYISKDTYLAVRSEETHLDETGARIETTRELVESMNFVPPTQGESPFELGVPASVPVRRQSAYDHLIEVLRAFERAPRFLAQTQTH